MSFKILYIEDEPFLAQIVCDGLKKNGYEVLHVADGAHALEAYNTFLPDLSVVDIMLPHLDGYSITEEIRKKGDNKPIIFLSAKNTSTDVVKGFNKGGNDYLRKPFSIDELFVRIESLLERFGTKKEDTNPLQNMPTHIGKSRFDFIHQKLYTQSGEYNLSYKEACLLKMLIEHKKQVLERKKALMEIWGNDGYYNTRSMDVFVSHLRKLLHEDENIQLLTIRGIGYKLLC